MVWQNRKYDTMPELVILPGELFFHSQLVKRLIDNAAEFFAKNPTVPKPDNYYKVNYNNFRKSVNRHLCYPFNGNSSRYAIAFWGYYAIIK